MVNKKGEKKPPGVEAQPQRPPPGPDRGLWLPGNLWAPVKGGVIFKLKLSLSLFWEKFASKKRTPDKFSEG